MPFPSPGDLLNAGIEPASIPHSYTCKNGSYQKDNNNKCWQECGEKGTLVYWWWERKLVQPLWKTVWRFLKKLKIKLCVCMCVCVYQSLSHVQLCDLMDCSLPGSSIHGILQARILEWVAIPFSREIGRAHV